MIVEVVNQVRNSIRCSAATPEKYPHYVESALERLDEAKRIYEQGERRRELRSALQRIQRYSIGPEKQSLQTVIEGLDRKLVTDAVIDRMLPAARVRLARLPLPEQHRTLPVMTRGLGSSRTISFIASTDSVDRHKTLIRSMGIEVEKYLRQNPIVGFQHDLYGSMLGTPDPANIIGKTVAIRKFDHRMEADIEFLRSDVNPRAEMLLKMVRAGAVSSVSIGFIPREVHQEMIDGETIPVIARCELLEISLCAIPSQSDAIAMGRD